MSITLEHRCVHARVLLPRARPRSRPDLFNVRWDPTLRPHEPKSGGGRDLFVPFSPDRDTAPLR